MTQLDVNQYESQYFMHEHELHEKDNSLDYQAALALLLSSSIVDITNVEATILSIDSVISRRFPLIIFIEQDFPLQLQNRFRSLSLRRTYFSFVNFTDFPKGFQPKHMKSTWIKRSKWGYQQMCRFWASLVWENNLIKQYKFIMRIDSDSYYKSTLPGHFPILADGIVYVANGVSIEASFVSVQIFDVVKDYLTSNSIIPRNRALWDYAELLWNQSQEMPMFYNNFEIARTDFFLKNVSLTF
jgi:hypothetical protein